MPAEPIQPNKMTQPPMKIPVEKKESMQELLANQKFTLAVMQAILATHNATVEDQIQKDIEYARELELIKEEHAETKHMIEMLINGEHAGKFEDINI